MQPVGGGPGTTHRLPPDHPTMDFDPLHDCYEKGEPLKIPRLGDVRGSRTAKFPEHVHILHVHMCRSGIRACAYSEGTDHRKGHRPPKKAIRNLLRLTQNVGETKESKIVSGSNFPRPELR